MTFSRVGLGRRAGELALVVCICGGRDGRVRAACVGESDRSLPIGGASRGEESVPLSP